MSLQNEKVSFHVGPTVDVAAGTDIGFVALVVPGPTTAKYQIEQLGVAVDAAITADGTNFSIWTLKNETTGVTLAVRTWIAGNSTALSFENLNLSAVTSSVTTIPGPGALISGGDILSWVKTHGGTGLAMRPRIVGRLTRVQG